MDGFSAISVNLQTNINKFYIYPDKTVRKNNFTWTERRPNLQDSLANENCFLVFIGHNYVHIIDKVIETVEELSKFIGLQPLGLFVASDQIHVDTKTVNAIYPLVNNF